MVAPWPIKIFKTGNVPAASLLQVCFAAFFFIPLAVMPFQAMGADADVSQVPAVSVVIPGVVDPVHQRIARVLESQLYQRCGAQMVIGTGGDVVVELKIEPGGEEDGYTIADRPGGGVLITGNNHRGLLYGVGKFLRSSAYEDNQSKETFIPGTWRGSSSPVQSHRAVYWWTHIGPRWRNAQLENIKIDVEEMGLWGANIIAGCFPVQGGYGGIPGYSGLYDPALTGLLLRLETMLSTATDLGLKTCLFVCPNTAYGDAPDSILADPNDNSCAGNHGVRVCPSIPVGEKYLLRQWEGIFKYFQSTRIDELVFFPYDEGGCSCELCRPWGGNGFLRLSRKIKEMADTLYPGIESLISTWCFNKNASGPNNEMELLAQSLAEDKSWVDYIIPDYRVEGHFPQYMIDNGVPGDLPAVNFAEISMKWHGWNAKTRGLSPNPKKVAEMWALTKDNYTGGIIPYCEHIYTDADMVMMAQLSWAPGRPAAEILNEYTHYEFSGAHTDTIINAINQNEAGNTAGAAQILTSVEPKLTSYQRDSWRWRSFMCRVTGASALDINLGTDPPRNRLSLNQAGEKTATASSELDAASAAGKANDGIYHDENANNIWASANNQDGGSWWQVDLGASFPISEVKVQFRGFDGVFHFVPETITFQVSDDGANWTTVISKSADVPDNNTPYSASMYRYLINAEGRYVRLLFEDGADDMVDGIKVVELVEVEVIKAFAVSASAPPSGHRGLNQFILRRVPQGVAFTVPAQREFNLSFYSLTGKRVSEFSGRGSGNERPLTFRAKPGIYFIHGYCGKDNIHSPVVIH